ncbi:MAG: glycosyltransferase family 4 protein [Desulfuromonadales bacterium]|nr:glycosyltransferase family 4 protein [Desulfuromonadales bacterium]
MNILIVTQYFWPETFRINDLALGLKARGHSVEILTGIPNYPHGTFYEGYGLFNRREELYEGIHIRRVPLMPRKSGGSIRLFLNYLSFCISASIAALLLKHMKPDAIIVFEPSPITVGIPALLCKARHKAPVLFWVQDLWPETLVAVEAVKSRSVLDFVEKLVKFIYKRCDMILVQSRAFMNSVRKHCDSDAIIEYLPNCAEEFYQPFASAADSPETKMLPPGFVVMFAGNIGVAQDFPTILDAAELTKDITDIKWVVIGDGRQREWLQNEIVRRDLANSIFLLGRHPAEQMPRFFAGADVLIVTLKRDPIFALTIPSKIQSYLACARPIIAALDGEAAKIVQEARAGLACPAESPRELADAVISLYNMPDDERASMGERGRQYYEKEFDRTMLLDRLEGWMNSLVREKRLR